MPYQHCADDLPVGKRTTTALRSLVMCVPLLASGCASIVTGSNQVLSVETRYNMQPAPGASCQLTNDKGTYFVSTPGTVTVKRSYGDLAVKCEKEKLDPGIASVKSSTKGMMYGNLLFGGIIGAAVDIETGAGYDYPDFIHVLMGQTTVIAPTPAPTPAPIPTPQAKTE